MVDMHHLLKKLLSRLVFKTINQTKILFKYLNLQLYYPYYLCEV